MWRLAAARLQAFVGAVSCGGGAVRERGLVALREKGARASWREEGARAFHTDTKMAAAGDGDTTLVVRLPPLQGCPAQLSSAGKELVRKHAAPLLADNELVSFPTETVYGLGANALSEEAVSKIYVCKGRPSDNPLIVHVSDYDMLARVVHPDHVPRPGSIAKRLCDAFWPGPLTILFPKADAVPSKVTAGGPNVAVRMPAHPVALSLIHYAGVPVAAPSANRSGRPSPTSAFHVLHDLSRSNVAEVGENENSGRVLLVTQSPSRMIDEGEQDDGSDSLGVRMRAEDGVRCVVDGGSCAVGVESTVVDTLSAEGKVVILRPGGVTREQLQGVCAEHGWQVEVLSLSNGKKTAEEIEAMMACPPTPGLKYRHYSPRARVLLVDSADEVRMGALLQQAVEGLPADRAMAILHTRTGVKLPAATECWLHCAVEDGKDFALGAEETATLEGGSASQCVLVDFTSTDDSAAALARCLFSVFRALDAVGIRVIVVEGVKDSGIGLAVMNRVRKAAVDVLS